MTDLSVKPDDEVQTTASQRFGIVVLGMHRSGTSALSRVLALAGCDLPRTLMGPGVGNVTGHWESGAVVDWNDRLLASVGSRWNDWLPFHADWFRSPKAAETFRDAERLLESEYGNSYLFVLKDPRICRFAPVWLNALKSSHVAPRVLLPVRNPMEVAASLAARNNMSPALGALLWLRHVLDAEYFSRGNVRVTVAYDDLLRCWPEVLRRAGDALGLTWPSLSASRAREISSFLSGEYRHHTLSDDSTLNDLTLADWLREVFGIFRKWAAEGESTSDHARLDEIRLGFNGASSLLMPINDFASRVTELEDALAQERAKVARIGSDPAQTAAESAALRARLTQAERAYGQSRAEADQIAERLSVAEQQTIEAGARANGLATRVSELENALLQRSAKAAETGAKLAEVQAEAEALRARVVQAESAYAQTRTEADQIADRLNAAEKQTAEERARANGLASRVTELEQTIAQQVAEAVGRAVIPPEVKTPEVKD